MSIRSYNLILSLAALLLVSTCAGNVQVPEQPNIIVFLVDDMGWQDTSVPFWNKRTPFNDLYQTPNMERLAAEGMKFTQAYATAVCSPTRISLMTGMNAAHHRVTNWTLRKDKQPVADDKLLAQPAWNVNGMSPVLGIASTIHATPLPQLLHDAGYFTIHSGKAHLGAIGTPAADPLNLGFDINIAGHAAGAPGSYYGTEAFGNNDPQRSVWAVPGLEEYHGQEIYLSEAITLEAVGAMQQAVDQEQPFFLYMAHYAVHTPIQGDDRFVQKYIDQGMLPVEAKYASMVEGMDKSLGDIMAFLDEQSIDDNTIILFMSDNGGLSAVARGGEKHTHNRPLSSGKGSAHEGGIREPMIVKWPGKVKPNSTTDDYLIIEDFFPSILEMASIQDYETVQPVDGISFVPILAEKDRAPYQERPLFWHYPNRWGPQGPGIGSTSTVRLGDWKLIYYHADRSFELFNLMEDIGETRNQATDQREKLKELASVLTDHLKKTDAQMPTDKATGKLVEYPLEILQP